MDKSHPIGWSSPSPQGRCSVSSPPNVSCNAKSELSASSDFPPLGAGTSSEHGHFGHEMPSDSSQFSLDISRMPDNPPKNLGHRRAYSEILTVLDEISFDSDLGVVGELDETEEYLLPMYKSTTIKPEMLVPSSEDPSPAEPKKSISAVNLVELVLVDSKRAKRIWANRHSAARSKERKMRYIAELERKVQTLQTETTSLSAQFALLQRDTNGLASENTELKLQFQTIEQQVHLQDALNDALREEIQHLKALTGQANPNGGPLMSMPKSYGSANQQYYTNNTNHAARTLISTQKLQHLHLHSPNRQHQFPQHPLHHFPQPQLQQH